MAFGGSIPAKGTGANSTSVTELHGRPLTSRLLLPEDVVLTSAACASAEPSISSVYPLLVGGACVSTLLPGQPGSLRTVPQEGCASRGTPSAVCVDLAQGRGLVALAFQPVSRSPLRSGLGLLLVGNA